MRKKMILLAAILCAGPLASENIPTEDRHICQKHAEKTLEDCSAARRYFHAMLAVRHLREVPESPGRPLRYLQQDEKKALANKQDSLLEAAGGSEPSDGTAPGPVKLSAKDEEICEGHRKGILTACVETRAYFRQAAALAPGQESAKKPAGFGGAYLSLEERALLSKKEEKPLEAKDDSRGRDHANVNEADRVLCAGFSGAKTQACLAARDYFRFTMRAKTLEEMPKRPKGYSEYLRDDEKKAYREKTDRLLDDKVKRLDDTTSGQ